MTKKKKYHVPMYLIYYTDDEVEAVNENAAAEIATRNIRKSEAYRIDGQDPDIEVIWDCIEEVSEEDEEGDN